MAESNYTREDSSCKKLKTDSVHPKNLEDSNINSDADKSLFKDFQINKVLNEDVKSCMICVEGRFFGNDDPAVVIASKTPFSLESAKSTLSDCTKSNIILENDIYKNIIQFPEPSTNTVKTTLIYPATAKHIEKYTRQNIFFINESYEDYINITKPFLELEKYSIQWVYNILEKKTESERIIFEDSDINSGFVLLPDLKWDGIQIENLYLVAIVQNHQIQSLRDLNSDHVKMLENILQNGQKAIKEKYGVDEDQLRIYVHYQPSYYHFHVHFTHLKFEAPGATLGRAHFLTDIIENIKLLPDYYQKKTLKFTIKESDSLFKAFKNAKRSENLST